MLPIRIIMLCSLVLVLLYLHDSDAWRRRSFRFRAPRIRVSHVVPRIRVPTPRIRVPTPRIRVPTPRIRVRRVVDNIKDVVDDARDVVSDVKDKIKGVVACRRISSGRIVNRCSGGGDDHSSDSAGAEIIESEEITVPEPEVDYCRNMTLTETWGAATLPPGDSLSLPVKTIALYMGETDCLTADCSPTARASFSEGENYNFMIDGHGKLYEGRGWRIKSNHHVRESVKQTEYGILLIMTENPVFEKAFNDLVSCGLQLGTLDSTFNSTTDLKFRF